MPGLADFVTLYTQMWDPKGKLAQRGLIAAGALTVAGRQFRDGIEERTDAMEQEIVEAIGDDFETLVAQLQHWSNLCIAAKTFTSDVYKRAAG